MSAKRSVIHALLLFVVFTSDAHADEPLGLTLSDLASYRAALDGKPNEPPIESNFRALWDTPQRFQGRRVRIDGQLVRRFRQDAFGTFPPLVEAWAVSPAGDPFCLVYPLPKGKSEIVEADLGALVRFEGTFLRQLKYQGSDTARLAPLIVGDKAPTLISPAPAAPQSTTTPSAHHRLEITLGLLAAFFIAFLVACWHIKGARIPRRSSPEPAPEFLENM